MYLPLKRICQEKKTRVGMALASFFFFDTCEVIMVVRWPFKNISK